MASAAIRVHGFLAEFTFDTTRAAILLMTTGVLDRHPDIRFQLSHAGGTLPFLGGRLGVVSASPVGELWPDSLPKVALLHTEELFSRFHDGTALSSHRIRDGQRYRCPIRPILSSAPTGMSVS